MTTQKQNPGGQAGASREVIYRDDVHFSHTALDRQAQLLASRFHLSRWMAREVARLCFGEGRHA
jgi:hypothetical protein